MGAWFARAACTQDSAVYPMLINIYYFIILAPVESQRKHCCVVQIELDEWTEGVGEPRDVGGKRERNDMADTHVLVKRSDTILRTSSSCLNGQSMSSSAAHHDGEKLLCSYDMKRSDYLQ